MARGKSAGTSITHLVVSNEKRPAVRLKPGMKLEVHSVKLVDARMRPHGRIGARLCSGGGTCIALVHVERLSKTKRS